MEAVCRKFLSITITLLAPLLLYAQGNNSQEKIVKISKVVIDPGHGGKDPGCVYKNIYEKDIVLSIGLKLGDLIRKNLPDVQIYYTRTTDKYIGLQERANVANKAGADLFISIHINAVASSAVSGTSTYIVGLDKTSQNMEVAMKENDVVIYEDDYTTKYEGYTPGDPTSYIMFSLMQSAYRDQSMQFAEIIQKHYVHDLPIKNRGAFQGPFLVLWYTSMPAVLTEIGFMSNESDRNYINANKGQSDAARSLFNAFSEYKSKVEGKSSAVMLRDRTSLPDITAQLTAEQKKEVEAVAKAEKEAAAKQAATTAAKPAATTKPAAQTASAAKPAATTASKPAAQTASAAKPAATTAAKPAAQTAPTASAASNIRFYVQIASLAKPKDKNSADFRSYRGKVVEKKAPNGAYKYMVGGYTTYDEGMRQLSVVRREFADAFLVAYEGDEQLKLDDARKRAK